MGHKPVKNQILLLEIMKKMKEHLPSKLLLVGDGELRKSIQADVASIGLAAENIHFLGIREDIGTILSSIDVFIFPSLSEGLGLVLLEAQACGIPCIVSEAVPPEANLDIGLVTAINLDEGPAAWADKVIALLSKKERDISKIVDGFEKNGYSIKRGIAHLMHIYQINSGGENEAGSLI